MRVIYILEVVGSEALMSQRFLLENRALVEEGGEGVNCSAWARYGNEICKLFTSSKKGHDQ